MIIQKISVITLTALAIATCLPSTSHANNETIARVILGGGAIAIGASKIYANRDGISKQQKRHTLIGAGIVTVGIGIISGPHLYSLMNQDALIKPITQPAGYRKPLPTLPLMQRLKQFVGF